MALNFGDYRVCVPRKSENRASVSPISVWDVKEPLMMTSSEPSVPA